MAACYGKVLVLSSTNIHRNHTFIISCAWTRLQPLPRWGKKKARMNAKQSEIQLPETWPFLKSVLPQYPVTDCPYKYTVMCFNYCRSISGKCRTPMPSGWKWLIHVFQLFMYSSPITNLAVILCQYIIDSINKKKYTA